MRRVNIAFALPGHGFGIRKDVGQVELERGMHDDEIVEEDVVGKGAKKVTIVTSLLAGAVVVTVQIKESALHRLFFIKSLLKPVIGFP